MKDQANYYVEKVLFSPFLITDYLWKSAFFQGNFGKEPKTWRILSAAGVTGPLAASATILAWIRRALSFRITCKNSTVLRINRTSSTVFQNPAQAVRYYITKTLHNQDCVKYPSTFNTKERETRSIVDPDSQKANPVSRPGCFQIKNWRHLPWKIARNELER